jgi:hypothetical protein
VPIVGYLHPTTVDRSARSTVVDENHAMADKDLVPDRDAGANEGMARYLAALSNLDIALDFHKGPDSCIVADLAAVQIYEWAQSDALPQFNIFGDNC